MVERELVGGECSYWACIPSKTLLRPGEAAHDANDAAAVAKVDVEAALAWRDFMVSKHTDTTAATWLTDRNIDLLRGNGGWPGAARWRWTVFAAPPDTSWWPPAPNRSFRRFPVCVRPRGCGPTAR